jgi:hypothetical protein
MNEKKCWIFSILYQFFASNKYLLNAIGYIDRLTKCSWLIQTVGVSITVKNKVVIENSFIEKFGPNRTI